LNADEFTKFNYITECFDKIETMIDELFKKQEISDDERLVMGHQLERLDRWVHQAANKIGYHFTTWFLLALVDTYSSGRETKHCVEANLFGMI
jgi:hypothetical protein